VGVLFAEPLFTHLLGPSYAAAAACFRPLVWSCVLMFSNVLMFAFLYALNDDRTALAGISGAIRRGKSCWTSFFVPRYGIVAAGRGRGWRPNCLNWALLNIRIDAHRRL